MKLIQPALLSALLLSLLACTPPPAKPAPQPPAPIDPPGNVSPINWNYSPQEMLLTPTITDAAVGMEFNAYVTDSAGHSQTVEFIQKENYKIGLPIARMMAASGTIDLWGQDTTQLYDPTSNQSYYRFGGGKYHWRYGYIMHTEETPWRLEYPVGPITFEKLSRFPWEDKLPGATPGSYQANQQLSNYPIGGPFIGCNQADVIDPKTGLKAKQGLYLESLVVYTTQWQDVKQFKKPPSFNTQLIYLDDYNSTGITSQGQDTVDFFYRYPGFRIDGKLHYASLFAYSDGVGPYPQPWEKRWFRMDGRNFGASLDASSGKVTCHSGEWKTSEVTDPTLVAKLNDVNAHFDIYQYLPPELQATWP